MNQSIPPVLYHYTTMDTVFSILNNAVKNNQKANTLDSWQIQLWASHILFCNDPLEHNFYFECIIKSVKNYFRKKMNAKDLLMSWKLNRQLSKLDKEEHCILSLSENKDCLPMWRGYSNNGQGVSIGLDTVLLRKKLDLFLEDKFEIIKCTYKSPEEIITEFNIDEFEDNILKTESTTLTLKQNYVNKLFIERKKYKHHAYSYEGEWRLLLNPDKSNLEYRMRGGVILPFVRLNLPLSIIKSICLGPTTVPDISEAGLDMLLESKFGNLARKINIQISDVPYTIL